MKRKGSFRIAVAEICRAILWILDKQRENGGGDMIDPYDVQQKTGVNHNTIKTFLRRFDENGIKIHMSETNERRIKEFIISEGLEDYLRETFLSY